MRITKSTPQTVRHVCEKEARNDDLSQQSPCMCHAMTDVPGNLFHVEGHVALVPIHIPARMIPSPYEARGYATKSSRT